MATAKKNKISVKAAGAAVTRWGREMRSELKKVVWPTRKQLLNNCIVAIVMMLICGVIIGAFDQIAALVLRWIISLGDYIN